MKTTTSKSLFLFITLLISLLLVACQDSPPNEETPIQDTTQKTTQTVDSSDTDQASVDQPTPDDQTTTTDNTSPPTTQPTLTILADEVRAPILERLSQSFAEERGIIINIQTVFFPDLLDTFKATANTPDGPDIIIGPHDWLGELVADDLILPLELASDQRATFLPSAINGFSYQGKLYGLPYAVENVAFFRNTNLVPEAPRTWAEVSEIAAQLESENKVAQAFLMNADPYHFYPIQTAFGGYVFGWDNTGSYDPTKIGLDSEGSLAAANWLETMVADGHLGNNYTWEEMYQMFESGRAAMLITGPWALNRIRESTVPYAISPLPTGVETIQAGLPFVGIQGFMLSATTKDPALAQSYLTDFILTEAMMQTLFETNSRPPAYLPTRRNIEDPDLAAFAAIGSNGLPMPAIPQMGQVWDAWEVALTQILTGQETGEQAFITAAEEIRTKIELNE